MTWEGKVKRGYHEGKRICDEVVKYLNRSVELRKMVNSDGRKVVRNEDVARLESEGDEGRSLSK